MLMINRKLAARLEKIDAAHSAAYALQRQDIDPLVQPVVQKIGEGTAIYGGDNLPINRVIGLGVTSPVSDTIIAEVSDFYAKLNATPHIDFCPLADGSLLTQLRQSDYKPTQLFTMLVRQLPATEYAPPDSEAHVAPADDMQLWTQTVSQGIIGTDEIPEDDVNPIFARIAFMRPDVYCHIAYINGVPAGAGAIAIQDEVAVFFAVSTRTHFRRKGIQANLMKARLDLATEKGCELAMGLAIPGSTSERNLQRGGFKIAYTKMVFAL